MQSQPRPQARHINASADRLARRLERRDAEDGTWRPLARRLLIGVALVVIGLGWMILNATVWAPKDAARSPLAMQHGPVATAVQTLDGMKVRPELVTPAMPASVAATTTEIRVTFHSDTATPHRADFRDLALRAGGRTFTPIAVRDALPRARALSAGQFVTGTVRFAHAPSPGATVVYTPPWAKGRSLHWLLYR